MKRLIFALSALLLLSAGMNVYQVRKLVVVCACGRKTCGIIRCACAGCKSHQGPQPR